MSAVSQLERPTILDLSHGLHLDVPSEVYHERVIGLASKSTLDDLHRSPAHYQAAMSAKNLETDALRVGTAMHTALFEPDVYDRSYVVQPDFGDCRFKEAKAKRDEWRSLNAAKTIIDAGEAASVIGMVTSIRKHPIASRLFTHGSPEVTLRWRDAATGIECKSRADYYQATRRACIDLKTTEDARTEGVRRSVARYGYHRQEAMYRDAFAAIGAPLEWFVFVFVEKAPPYAVGLYSLDTVSVQKGRATIRADLNTLLECIETGDWPAYSSDIQSLSIPDWTE